MKKPWLLILAGIILTILIGVWLYLFFGGDEAREDLYNRFGFAGDELPFDLGNIFTDENASTSSPYLRQLSLRQSGGYIALDASSSSPRTTRFMESGTGHIYSVRVDDGAEERLSNITIAAARKAVFSVDGNFAAITTDGGVELTLLTLPHGSITLDSRTIQAAVIEAGFTSDNKLLYAAKEGQSVRGYSYDLETAETKPLFIIPFREAVVMFGGNEAGPHYAYPKTAEELEGYLYKIENGSIERHPISGFGLSVQATTDIILFTRTENATPKSFVMKDGAVSEAGATFIPEKCTPRGDVFLCAIDAAGRPLTDWYRGEYVSNDSLWYFIPEINYATSIDTLGTTAGRVIDVTYPSVTNTALYFINRVDTTLWVYDRDFAASVLDN